MPEIPAEIKPPCKWTNDCQGKKDYDGNLIQISTRYWPPAGKGGGMLTVDGRIMDGALLYHSKGWASAKSKIVLRHGGTLDCGEWPRIVLASKAFEAMTEEEVKTQVEAWVALQCRRIGSWLFAYKSAMEGIDG